MALVCREGAVRLTDRGDGDLVRSWGRILVDQDVEHLDAEILGP